MPAFNKGPNFRTPFGRNVFLRSTQDVKTESAMVAASTVPVETIDATSQRILQPGTVMAVITSGPNTGRVGPFSAAASDGRQTTDNIVGINNTFLPWQLLERNVEIALVKEARVVQGWCFEYDAGNLRIALTDGTVAALQNKKDLSILFAPTPTSVT